MLYVKKDTGWRALMAAMPLLFTADFTLDLGAWPRAVTRKILNNK